MQCNPVVNQATELLKTVEFGSVSHDVALFALWHGLSSVHRNQLHQLLFHGPVWDGDVLSKGARTDLIELGLATRCCFKGEQGYTAATYLASTVWKATNP